MAKGKAKVKKKPKKSKLEEKLKFKQKNGWEKLSKTKEKKIYKFCEGYKNFLEIAKTEREAVTEIITQATAFGFQKKPPNCFCINSAWLILRNRSRSAKSRASSSKKIALNGEGISRFRNELSGT